jgi:5'-deoxynucleotidase YfbR-like HD superfamily hydrolase
VSISELLNAAYTRRFHTVRDNTEVQTIGEHSFGVSLIICNLHPNPTVNLLKAAIYHDLAEKELGDIPGQAKWRFQDYDKAFLKAERVVNIEYGIEVFLEPEEQLWLACADMLELYLYSIYRSGLVRAEPAIWSAIRGRVYEWFNSRLDVIPPEIAREVFQR